MSTAVPSTSEIIDRITNGVYPAMAMLAGMQLDIFSTLKDRPLSADAMALCLGVDPSKLRPLLYALVTADLLSVEEDSEAVLFSNTPEAGRFLVQDSPDYIGNKHPNLARRWGAILQTADSIRAGTAQAMTDFTGDSKEKLAELARGAHEETIAAGKDLATRCDFSGCRNILDLGGRTGGVSFALVDANPRLQATIADLPPTTPITKRYVEDSGLGDRVRVVAVNILDAPPEGSFDAAVLRNLIQVLNPSEAIIALKNVIKAIEPGGTIYIIGSILDDSRLSPKEAVASSLNFLNIYDGGQSFTEAEYRQWLDQAGFEGTERVVLPDGHSIIKAIKPTG